MTEALVQVPLGSAIVSAVALAILVAIGLVEHRLEAERRPTLGMLLQTWSQGNPWFAVVLAGLMGALIGHFFWPWGI